MSFLSMKNADIILSEFTVLSGWWDAAAFPKEVLIQLNSPSSFPTKNLREQFSFIHSTFQGEEALHEQENRTLRSQVVNAGAGTVDKHRDWKNIQQSTSTARLLHDYLVKEGHRVWAEKRRVLHDVCVGWSAALLSLESSYDDELWVPRSRGRFLLTKIIVRHSMAIMTLK